jgi:hypothetical protein
MKDRKSPKQDAAISTRRGFLKGAGLGAAGAAVGATVGAAPEAAATASGPNAAGYRETEHVKTFYRTARF